MTSNTNYAARLTPRGRGAVATIRVRSDTTLLNDALPFHAANGRPLCEQPHGLICFGHWGVDVPEDVVFCRIDEQTTEIHCHGGEAAQKRILQDLQDAGFQILTWQELEEREQGLLRTECLQAMSRAITQRTALILLEQYNGLLEQTYRKLQEWSNADDALENVALKTQLDDLLKWADFGLHLSEPWLVVLAGKPNVGKSSLINALVGFQRSIVFDQPGTTRDVVTAETAIDGWPVLLADTAGLRDSADLLETAGIEKAKSQLGAADCRVILLDRSIPPEEFDRQLLNDWLDAIIVAHKCDLPNVWGDELPETALRVSSKTGEGVPQLLDLIAGCLVSEIPSRGTPIPVTQRQVDILQEARSAFESRNKNELCSAVAKLLKSQPDESRNVTAT